MTLHRFLKSNLFAIIIAILSVIVQSFHSYIAFYNTSSLKGSAWGVAQAVLFSLVIDSAILFYTVRNKKNVALGFSIAMILINTYYYFQHLGISFEFAFGVFLSLIIPISVYFYSEEIHEEPTEKSNDTTRADAMIAELQAVIRSGKKDNERLSARIDQEKDGRIAAQDEVLRLKSIIAKNAPTLEEIEEILPNDKTLIGVEDVRPLGQITSTGGPHYDE
jgi:hypothetical protein